MGKFVILVGPSGSGKTAVAEVLLRTTSCVKVTTCTTRNPRPGEIDGIHYHFLTEEEFANSVEQGVFIETFKYAGHNYGTRYQDLNELIENDMDVVIVMEINGARKIKERFPDNTYLIYLNREFRDLVMAILERDISNDVKADRIAQLPADIEVGSLDCIDFRIDNVTGKLKETVAEVETILRL